MPAAEFDSFATSYESDLAQALAVSGESKDFFAQGRVRWLAGRLRARGFQANSVLDYGCGTGSTAVLLREVLGASCILGLDVSGRSIDVAKALHEEGGIRFLRFNLYTPAADIDVAYCNGVFHHIPVAERDQAVTYIYRALRPGGMFALWENNPWNPGTRYVMSKCAFDKNAVTLSPPETVKLVQRNGFQLVGTDFRFFFPRALRWLRPLESILTSIPLGAQYMVLSRRPS